MDGIDPFLSRIEDWLVWAIRILHASFESGLSHLERWIGLAVQEFRSAPLPTQWLGIALAVALIPLGVTARRSRRLGEQLRSTRTELDQVVEKHAAEVRWRMAADRVHASKHPPAADEQKAGPQHSGSTD